MLVLLMTLGSVSFSADYMWPKARMERAPGFTRLTASGKYINFRMLVFSNSPCVQYLAVKINSSSSFDFETSMRNKKYFNSTNGNRCFSALGKPRMDMKFAYLPRQLNH